MPDSNRTDRREDTPDEAAGEGTADSDGTRPARAGSTERALSDDVDLEVSHLSYEEARDELIAIVARLEAGEVGLTESMVLWQRGDALAAHCSAWLDRAEQSLGATDDDT